MFVCRVFVFINRYPCKLKHNKLYPESGTYIILLLQTILIIDLVTVSSINTEVVFTTGF